MSVLVVEPDEVNGPAVVALLVQEGDEVGVISVDPAAGERWRALGAHVAMGSADDADLIERAAQHARSIVLFDAPTDVISAVVEGARMASSTPARILYCSTRGRHAEPSLGETGLEYVLLGIPGARFGLRGPRRLAPERVAQAVNAADDLAGDLRMSLDLSQEDAWRALGIPAGKG